MVTINAAYLRLKRGSSKKQASKLGPLLFIIFVNDLPQKLASNLGTKVGNVFASDLSFVGDTVLTADAPA